MRRIEEVGGNSQCKMLGNEGRRRGRVNGRCRRACNKSEWDWLGTENFQTDEKIASAENQWLTRSASRFTGKRSHNRFKNTYQVFPNVFVPDFSASRSSCAALNCRIRDSQQMTSLESERPKKIELMQGTKCIAAQSEAVGLVVGPKVV